MNPKSRTVCVFMLSFLQSLHSRRGNNKKKQIKKNKKTPNMMESDKLNLMDGVEMHK